MLTQSIRKVIEAQSIYFLFLRVQKSIRTVHVMPRVYTIGFYVYTRILHTVCVSPKVYFGLRIYKGMHTCKKPSVY